MNIDGDFIHVMKRYDTGEPVRAVILSSVDGRPVDLTGVGVLFCMYQVDDVTGALVELVKDSGGVEIPETDGVVRYNWKAGDTDVVGNHLASFELTYQSGEKETYPRGGYMEIRIEEDLENS